MADKQGIVVAVEDMATASIVAVEAAHVAMERGAPEVVFVHALDRHTTMGAILGASGYCPPVMETDEEGRRVLSLAEQAFNAEYQAREQAPPAIIHEIVEGDPTEAIEQAVRTHGAAEVVLGARRPHAFGRLVHPCVHTRLSARLPCPIHVASLQEAPA